jgi:glycerol-3-phosphate acyltransferase PlsY
LLGSIPWGAILYYLKEKSDIRQKGSGNIGAANVLRNGGKIPGLVTLALDVLKGMLPVIYGLKHFPSPVIIMLGAAAVILGHQFPLYIKFKGGKGVATFWGVFLAFYFPAALVFGAVFLAVLHLTRRVSASSIAAVSAVFFVALFTQVVDIAIIVFCLTVLIILKHHANIRRIAAGTEYQFSWTNTNNE